MDEIVGPSKAKGAYAYWGTQPSNPELGFKTPSLPSIAVSPTTTSSTPFNMDIPGVDFSCSPLKRRMSSLGVSSSSSSKRLKPRESETVHMAQILNKIDAKLDELRNPELTPAVVSGVVSATMPADEARKLFLSNLTVSKDNGDEWISGTNFLKLIKIFNQNEKLAKEYLDIAGYGDEMTTCEWVWGELAKES
jgi:hypothetical protein